MISHLTLFRSTASGNFTFNVISDLSLDTISGDLYFAGYARGPVGTPQRQGAIGVINTDGEVAEITYTADTYLDFVMDSINR